MNGSDLVNAVANKNGNVKSEIYKLGLSAETAKKFAEILRDDVLIHFGFVSYQAHNNKA